MNCFPYWARFILEKTMKTRKRLQDVLKLLSLQTIQGSPTPEEMVIHNEGQSLIHSVIAALDEKHRLPILLRYAQGMSIAEIAQVLEVSEGTIHSRLHYAHLKLRDRLKASSLESGNSEESVS